MLTLLHRQCKAGMARVRSVTSRQMDDQQETTAGKHPTLRPAHSSTPQPAASDIVRKKNGHKMSKSRCEISSPKTDTLRHLSGYQSTHHMRTRSRSLVFRLSDLPAEIRTRIYEYALSDDSPIDLATLKLPASLSISRQLRKEMLPIYFVTNTFTADVRSSWCVRRLHHHREGHRFSDEAGILPCMPDLWSSLYGHLKHSLLPERAVRFHHVKFNIGCCCCEVSVTIATATLYKVRGQAKFEWARSSGGAHWERTLPTLKGMFNDVDVLVEQVFSARQPFDGYTLRDLRDVATDFVR